MIHKKVFEYIMENFMGNCTDTCPASELCENGRPVCDELTEIIDNQKNCFAELKIREFFIELAYYLKYGKVLYFIRDYKLIPFLNKKYGLGKK